MYFALMASNVSSVTVAPGSLLHRADKDFEVGEYVIPKGATIIAVTRGLMYDPKVSKNSLILPRDVNLFITARLLDCNVSTGICLFT